LGDVRVSSETDTVEYILPQEDELEEVPEEMSGELLDLQMMKPILDLLSCISAVVSLLS
jgi:hypothetical protein